MRTEMDLFSVVQLADSKAVTVSVRNLRGGETPILEATVGRVIELALDEEVSDEGPQIPINATPINVARPRAQSPDAEGSESSDSVHVVKVVNAPSQGAEDRKRKGGLVADDGATLSREKHREVCASESIPEPMADSGAHLAGPGAHATEAEAHVADVEGVYGAVVQDDVVRTPPPK